MKENYHDFHIPVMGTGHSADTAIRVAPFGITSVLSFVDDILLEQLRGYYTAKYNLPYEFIPKDAEDGRAKRTTAYLETVKEVIDIKLNQIKQLSFFANNDKEKYFDLLPDHSSLKKDYKRFLEMDKGSERDILEKELVDRMKAGSIDVNIMVKLDCAQFNSDGSPMSDIFSDAKAALRGYAESSLSSSIVFSAGMNQTLFTYIESFRDFYRDKQGLLKKKIILKVSDFRSALIQGKFLAKKGLEVHEFRIESGLNCGGHAFPTKGNLLGSVLQEFKAKRAQLAETFAPFIKKYYEAKDWAYPNFDKPVEPLVSVQGGIGTPGEALRLIDEYNVDHTGWGTPFLLVPEATCVDKTTLDLLINADVDDFFLSDVSPLGVSFNNLRNTGSELATIKRAKDGTPGSPCPKGFLAANTEFSEIPICVASRLFQKQKIEQIEASDISQDKKENLISKLVEKTCICHHLGNGALVELGITDESKSPQSICPSSSAAWFNKSYTLKEMVDYIYGRVDSLVSDERPNMFVKELELYLQHFENLILNCDKSSRGLSELKKIKANLEDGMDAALVLSKKSPFIYENLASIAPAVAKNRELLNKLFTKFESECE